MSGDALVPIEQRTVIFYDDEITAVLTDKAGEQQVFVPVRPICDFLGLNWSGQQQRINRDPVLSKVKGVCLIHTPGGPQEMLCIPLEFLNGWLFSINASRAKESVREQLITYQLECYKILADAFLGPEAREVSVSPTEVSLYQVREMGLAIARMAEEQIEFERRLTTTEGRLEKAAIVYGELTQRVETLEQRMGPGQPVTEDQASQISQAVKAVAMTLSKKSGTNQYGAVYGELYRKFGITSYKLLPAKRFNEAMEFLTEWNNELVGDEPF
jgi:hypothetical protein